MSEAVREPAAGSSEGDRQSLSPEARQFAGQLAQAAMAAENHVAWELLLRSEAANKAEVPTAELRRALESAWFQIEVSGPRPAGPRVWLLPHLFADVILELPGRTRVKVRAADVRAMLSWLRGSVPHPATPAGADGGPPPGPGIVN